MKHIAISFVLSLSLPSCNPTEPTNTASSPVVVDIQRDAEVDYLKSNRQYLETKPTAQQAKATSAGKNQWKITGDTVLKLQKRDGRQLDNHHYKTDSTWEIVHNGVTIDSDKMSYEYNGRSELGDRQIFAANNTFIIYESPAWSNHQYILFTRASADESWKSRYVDIPSIPYPGESGIDIMRISDTHIWVKDGGMVFRYPLSILQTTKADNPFTIG